LYGAEKDPVSVTISPKEVNKILHSSTGHNTIFKLAVPNGEPATVIIKDWQVDPVKGRLLHADLMRLSLTSVTRVEVSVQIIGEAVGVKRDGGILEIETREVPIECLPGDIPENIQVDVSNLTIGQHVTAGDLIYDREKIKVLMDPDHLIAGIIPPRLVEEAAPVAAAPVAEGGAAEPEVIKKGKTEGGGKE
jgi:large subunit ribosomal protein L25